MRFDLVRPCGNCPFRTDLGFSFHFRPRRGQEILNSFLRHDGTFACHKTLGKRAEDEDETITINEDAQHCAGALILDRKLSGTGSASLVIRLAILAEIYDPERLDMTAPVVDTEAEFIKRQCR